MFELIVSLENTPSPKLQICCRLHQVFLQDFLVFCFIHFYPHKPPRACCREVSPQNDAATIIHHSGDAVFMVMCSVTLCLVWWPKSFQLTSESSSCFLANCSTDVMWVFFSQSDFLFAPNQLLLSAQSLQSQLLKLGTPSELSDVSRWPPSLVYFLHSQAIFEHGLSRADLQLCLPLS